ncbi:MAG: FtsX-like permease family protein, partial [Acidobacteria bacterium]
IAGSAEGLHYDTTLDLKVLGFLLAVTLAAALLSGLLPALRAAGVDPLAGLKDRAALGAARLRAGRVLVAAQIALSLLLLAGAGLYVRTLVNLVRINPGFATENLLLFQVIPRQAGYKGAGLAEFYERVQQSLAALPGVRSAALTQFKLLGGAMSGGSFFRLPGHTFEGELKPQAHRLTVSETFFTTMGIPVLTGRGFSAGDVEGAAKVVVVNETFARKYLPGENPLGQSLRAGELKGVPIDWQIVGVCRDAKYTDIKNEVPPTVYFSFRQDSVDGAYFALRTSLPSLAVATAARKAVAAIDPRIPLADVVTQEQVRGKRISQERLFATLCSALAGLAILLSCIGLYGLTAYNVARRTSEIGLRMALGATGRRVAVPVLREALLLALLGVAVGLPAAFAVGRLIRSQLYGVAPHDPLALAAAVAALVAVALIAAWLPARRAARIDPMVALRCE